MCILQVIMPTFNASKYFAEALDSIADHREAEVLVIDDGSRDCERDAVAAICDQYQNVRFFPERHRGLVGTLNFGISIATAPFIARMDADDVSLPGRLDRQLAFLDANPKVALVGTQVEYIDATGNLTGKRSRFPTDPEALAKQLLTKGCLIQHPSIMVRADVLREVGMYRYVTQYAEDYDLWLRMSEITQLANLPDVFLRYRLHEGQISNADNFKQRFARDIALISARERRLGNPDPLQCHERAEGEEKIRVDRLSKLEDAYMISRRLFDGERNISRQEIVIALAAASDGLYGDGKSLRSEVLVYLTKYSARYFYFVNFFHSVYLLLKLKRTFHLFKKSEKIFRLNNFDRSRRWPSR